jgi:CheY-like chemotaxis protein
VPKTLLAVDDSATMRKVLEITFAGDDFRVVAVDGAASALGRMSEDPAAVVIDTALGGDDGYALAKEMRGRNARLAVVLLASRYNPYDPNRGRDAGVDDFIDKPFDTQMLIDKVKKAISTRELSRSAPPQPPPAAPHATTPFGTTTASFGSASRSPGVPAAPSITTAKPAWPAQRTHTLSFEGALPIVPAPVVAPAPPAPPRHVPPAAPPAAAVPASVAAAAPPPPAPRQEPATLSPGAPPAANGQFGRKLNELGLTPAQADAVLALSRELVERVVWEVVPQIAEALIKEEIARLTKEG